MVRAILDGEALTGPWFDRTKEYAARLRGESFTRYQYATKETRAGVYDQNRDVLVSWEVRSAGR